MNRPVLLFPRTKSLVACLVRKQSIEHHRHLPAPIGQKRQTREESMKAALRLLFVTTTLVLAGHGFAEVLPTAEPVTVDVSANRLSRIRTVLQGEIEAD